MYAKYLVASALASIAAASYNTTTVGDIQTSLVVVTSCAGVSDCTEQTHTTGVTVITHTSEEVTTQYTTFCPISSEEAASSAPAPAPSAVTQDTTADITSTNTATATASVPGAAESGSSPSASVPSSGNSTGNGSTPGVATGGAAKLSVGAAAFAGLVGFMLL